MTIQRSSARVWGMLGVMGPLGVVLVLADCTPSDTNVGPDAGPTSDAAQPLTDAAQPGSDASSTDASNPDASDASAGVVSCSRPRTVTNNVGPYFQGMSVDDQFVYWSEYSAALADGGNGARVAKVPVDGSSAPVNLFTGDCNGVSGFAADANNIYIGCVQVIDATHTVRIMRVPKNGSAPAPLWINDANGPNGALGLYGIGSDINSAKVFFATANLVTFNSIPAQGGSETEIASRPLPSFVDGFLYVKGFGADVYWQSTQGRLEKVPAGGGAATLAATDDSLYGAIDEIVLRDSYLYWRCVAPQRIARMPLGGGAVEPIADVVPLVGTSAGQLTIFGDNIYFAAHDGTVDKNLVLESYPLHPASPGDAGPGATTVIAKLTQPAPGFAPTDRNHVLANSTHLFVSDPGFPAADGHIYRCE